MKMRESIYLGKITSACLHYPPYTNKQTNKITMLTGVLKIVTKNYDFFYGWVPPPTPHGHQGQCIPLK